MIPYAARAAASVSSVFVGGVIVSHPLSAQASANQQLAEHVPLVLWAATGVLALVIGTFGLVRLTINVYTAFRDSVSRIVAEDVKAALLEHTNREELSFASIDSKLMDVLRRMDNIEKRRLSAAQEVAQ